MKNHLEFKDKYMEKTYLNYNLKRRKPILQMQIGAVGLFSFLGIFHIIYLQPPKKDTSWTSEYHIIVATIGILFSMFLGIFSKLRHKDCVIFLTNLLINFILIEPNFLVITETRDLSKQKFFWLGYRISAINLVLLLCYNSFIYKILQTSITVGYLLIRMRKEASLHNLLVDSSMSLLICIFFFIQEKGERMTYYDLHKISLQREDWKNFINFLPEGVAIFSNELNCVFMNESVKKIFNIYDAEDMARVILNLMKMNTDDQSLKYSRLETSPRGSKLIDHFYDFYKKFLKQSNNNKRKQGFKKFKLYNNDCKSTNGFDDNFRDQFFSEYEGKYLSLKLTHIDFDDMDATLVLISDISLTIKSHVLEENRKYRDMLFASFSHEIRTPLNCINLLLGKLVKTKNAISDKILKKYIYPSFYSGQILLHLVNDILDFSFLIHNELKLNINIVDIKQECLEIMEVITMQAKLKGINLNLKLDSKLPSVIMTDAPRLKQILCHLLLNALKYTYVGHITIRVMCSTEFENGIEVSVKDTGIGMHYDEQSRLQNKIRMTSLSNLKVSKNAAGASLKTILSQSLALMLGFEEDDGLKFMSKPNEGSEFYFVIKNYYEIQKQIQKDSRTLDQEFDVIEEKLRSGIQVKWFSEVRPVKIREISRCNNIGSIENMPKLRTEKPKLSDLYFIEENIDQASKLETYENYEKEDSIFMERQSKRNLPDFEEFMCIRQTERKKKKNFRYKSELINSASGGIFEKSTASLYVKQCSHAKILVVDDDEFNILAVKTILKQSSLSICSARNGVLAIELIKKEIKERNKCCKGFKLILMDVNMPVMGGLEAARLLKQDMKEDKIPWMPIVGCTAFVGSTDENECRNSGMDDYETKPLSNQKLTNLLEKWKIYSYNLVNND